MKINNETKIGMMVVVVIAILVGLTVKTGDFNFSAKGYEIKAHFKDIQGLTLNSPVNLNGLEVGRVDDITILYGKQTVVELTIWLREDAKLHGGAQAFVRNMGFMGEKYVGLTTGDDGQPYLTDGAVILGQEPASLEKVLGEGEAIAANLKEISEQINERLRVNSAAIDSIMANMDISMTNMASITNNVRDRLEVNKKLIDGLVADLSSASENLEEMSYDLKLNPWKLMYKKSERDRGKDSKTE